ncbi:MAG: DUF2298 domain-containing protein [Sphaerobacter sp.]|nr:DUF2298 domain-containing protein [Sphaerobacter sp.]
MSLTESLTQALVWYAVALGLSVLLYPLVYRAAPGLPDRGLSLAGPLGLLAAVIGPWWLSAAGLTPFSDPLLALVPLAVGTALWAHELRRGELVPFLRAARRALAALQVLTLVLFLGYVVFRGFNPDAAYTEKPMDMAFLNSAIHTERMPPPDPWFAGEPINYYYLGYVLMAALARLSGTAPGVAFSLSLATVFAYATTAAAGTAANLVRAGGGHRRAAAWLAGALGALFLVGIGNLVTPLRFLQEPRATLRAGWWEGVGWQASRVIVDHGVPGSSGPRPTINEFPAFSYVLGDLHPHVLAYPFFIATIALAFGLFRSAGGDPSTPRARLWAAAIPAGAVVGSLYALNAWDAPSAFALTGGALLIGAGACRRRAYPAIMALAVAALITALPFAVAFTPGVGLSPELIPAPIRDLPVLGRLVRTIGVVIWPRSSAISLLTVHGVFLAISGLLLAALLPWTPRPRRVSPGLLVGAVLAVAVLAFVARFAALVVIGLPLAALLVLLRTGRGDPALRATIALLAAAWALVLVPEVVFLQDAFGDRMNTVFKVYFQVWAMLAVAGAAALVLALPLLRARLGTAPAAAGAAIIAALVIGAALYPPLSAYRWTDGFREWRGLDALAYIGRADPAEGAALAWLAAHAEPGDVVLEAPGCSYGVARGLPHNRVSMAAGLPTVIGWGAHEYQWRGGRPDQVAGITQRQADVNAIYRDPESPLARTLLESYRVRYIYVGSLERVGYAQGCEVGPPYPDSSLAAIERLGWERVFAENGVAIYERPREASEAGRPN